jgi:radical SAM protein with 4Fe4S-binding SPASM domain
VLELSIFVLPTTQDGESIYFHSVTLQALPVTASLEELRAGCFLKGQEDEAIHRRLFAPPKILQLTIAPTWECNLRCTHCFVVPRLVLHDPQDMDPALIVDFVNRYCKTYCPKVIGLHFIGGEPLLRPATISAIVDGIREKHSNVQTGLVSNLAMSCSEEVLSCLHRMDFIGVSLDGVETEHNAQRKSLTGINPFQETLGNIRRLVDAGLRERLRIQSTLPEGVRCRESKTAFYRLLLEEGIKFENITVGIAIPKTYKPGGQFSQLVHAYGNPRVCCRFRFMSNFFIDPQHTLHIDYLDNHEQDVVGHLSDVNMSMLEQRFRKLILSSMPIFSDEQCMQCPALGTCWGGCVSLYVANGGQPSSSCGGPGERMKRVQKLSEQGKLAEFFIRQAARLKHDPH